MLDLVPEQLYRRLLEQVYNGDLSLIQDLVSADFQLHIPGVASGTYHGPAGLRTLIQAARAPFSSLVFRLDVGPITQGDLIAARWRATGYYAGGFPGATVPAGTQVTFGGHDFLRFKARHFTHYWGGADDLHLMSQLGLSPRS